MTATNSQLNQEATILDSEAAKINRNKAQVGQQGQNLNEAIKNYEAKVVEVEAKANQHNKVWAENEAKVARILASLKAMGVQNDDCKDALKDTSDGALVNIHAVCGRMFDGNR